MSSQASLLAHIERTARLARKALAGPASFFPFSHLYLPKIQRFVQRGTRVVRRVLVEPCNFADPSSRGFYMPLIQKLVQIRHARLDGGIFAFTSISPGEGVSYVIQTLAGDIARDTGGQILTATAAGLGALTPADVPDTGEHEATTTRVWHVNDTYYDSCPQPASLDPETLGLLRRRFDYVLVDCPAMKRSAAVLSIAKASEGVFMVVAAGQVRRNQIERAQELLEGSSSNLLGLILNKRTYPVPGFIYRHL